MTNIISTKYVAHSVDDFGNANYSLAENAVWHELITRQIPVIENRGCEEYIKGLAALNLSHEAVPQCPDISKILRQHTGWQLEPVPALISFSRFFKLLSEKKFPAATFIRCREELDYLQEPDIFHEVFGHCPLLTNQAYADFTAMYGKLALNATPEDRVMLARLYWFTIEFGLIHEEGELRAYGGGILSSASETIYCLESSVPVRRPFNLLDVLRTPYRIDIIQPIYYVIESFDILYQLIEMDLISEVQKARKLGMFEPLYNTQH